VSEIITDPGQLGRSEDDKFQFGGCLIVLLQSFIEVIRYLDGIPDFRYTFGLRRSRSHEKKEKAPSMAYGIQERCRNFLVVALINLAALSVPLRGASDVYTDAQKVGCYRNALIKYLISY
jgi:hypothetical protein